MGSRCCRQFRHDPDFCPERPRCRLPERREIMHVGCRGRGGGARWYSLFGLLWLQQRRCARRVWRTARFRAERPALNPFPGRRVEPASNRVGVSAIVRERADRRSRQGVVWKVDPQTQTTSMFMQAPTIVTGKSPGLNALTFDKSGNVYVSDSFQGVIWRTGPSGGTPTAWYAPTNPGQNNLLLPDANAGEILSPPFGANGIEFNNEGTALFALNTAYNSIVKIPVKTDGSAGTGVTFTTGLNGLAVDANDNLWIAANQGDEIVVVDPSGRVVAKKGDFNGVASDGSIQGLLFPASVEFSPDRSRLYITNLALYL